MQSLNACQVVDQMTSELAARRRVLVGRRDLVRAAWANSAPHHTVGRPAKVSKEEIVGMLAAVEAWRTRLDVQTQFREWESWYAHINEQLTKVPGVRTQVRGPARGGRSRSGLPAI